jgi:hypothetical protein
MNTFQEHSFLTTHVFGILNVSLEVAGAPQAIIEKYKLKKFVKFPGVLGEVWVRADAVSVCSTANATDHSDPPQSQSMLYVSGGPLKVNVEIETVKSLLETADGGGDTAASLTAMLSDGPSTYKPQRRVAPPSKTKPSRQ